MSTVPWSPRGCYPSREDRLRELVDRARIAHEAINTRWALTRRWARRQVLSLRARALLKRWTALSYQLHLAEERIL